MCRVLLGAEVHMWSILLIMRRIILRQRWLPRASLLCRATVGIHLHDGGMQTAAGLELGQKGQTIRFHHTHRQTRRLGGGGSYTCVFFLQQGWMHGEVDRHKRGANLLNGFFPKGRTSIGLRAYSSKKYSSPSTTQLNTLTIDPIGHTCKATPSSRCHSKPWTWRKG